MGKLIKKKITVTNEPIRFNRTIVMVSLTFTGRENAKKRFVSFF